MAQSFAEVSPEDISYIEAHGSGTHLGDPIEIAALTKAFSMNTNKKQFLVVLAQLKVTLAILMRQQV